MNNRIAYLVSKKLTGEISEMEIFELNDYLINNADLYETISLLEIAWQQELPAAHDAADVEKLLRKMRMKGLGFSFTQALPESLPLVPEWDESNEKSKSFGWKRLLSLAAALLLIAAASWWGYRFLTDSASSKAIAANEAVNQVTTKPGNRTRVVLRDGTRVWLNADSKLTYANDFGGTTREVNLTGEAYFDVVSNPEHPFIIHTPRTTVKVTGTTFNVRDYPGEARTETSLIHGKVEVRSVTQPEKVYYLKPNEKIVLKTIEDGGMPALVTKTVQQIPAAEIAEIVILRYDPIDSIPAETAWVNDQLAFNNESFRDIANKMEKWYNTKIEFAAPSLEDAHLTGKFEKESLQEALEALQYTTPFRFRRQGQTIVIYQ
jgi:ferric-dicitrate binding protein FerR (iron transport regulator)